MPHVGFDFERHPVHPTAAFDSEKNARISSRVRFMDGFGVTQERHVS